MAAAVCRPPDIPSRSHTPPPSLCLDTSLNKSPTPVPNKHIPICSPGAPPEYGLLSPPATPPDRTFLAQTQSVLHPPDLYSKLTHSPPVYAASASTVAHALHNISTRPTPEPDQVFPWLHGLHLDNQVQMAFFSARAACSRNTPRCLRGLTIVKAGGDLNTSRLKGAVAPDEILSSLLAPEGEHLFQDMDPKIGFSVRNFHIQACKMAMVSDIVVYGDDSVPRPQVEQLAQTVSQAQHRLRFPQCEESDEERDEFSTFIVTDPFDVFEAEYPDAVAIDSNGNVTGAITDFPAQERLEMCNLSKASEITQNVWLGPTPDPNLFGMDSAGDDDPQFDVLIEASDFATMPEEHHLHEVESHLARNDSTHQTVAHLEFPSSGSFAACENGTQDEADVVKLITFCRWLYDISVNGIVTEPRSTGHTDAPGEGADQSMPDIDFAESQHARRQLRVLVHCADGYTESSLLALAYFMFAQGIPAHDAWIRLHCEKGRDFFAYPPDKAFLENVQIRLLEASPRLRPSTSSETDHTTSPERPSEQSGKETPQNPPVLIERPLWMQKMDGSLPSRILPYLYLGNLSHAQNPDLLRELGVTRILSVGEPISWSEEDKAEWGGEENFLFIDNVQDNGMDPLTVEFERCLKFIEHTRHRNEATLVHCRVGVSRSATICIAEVMQEHNLSFPKAYCFVRARRLNVIIQPHLRFSYELLKWEETLRVRRGLPLQRELEWPTIAREIALMNRPYCRQ